MYGCTNCLENRWTFEYGEGIVTATCQGCGREVSFAAKRKQISAPRPTAKVKITKEGQPCRKCGTAVILQSHHKPPKNKYGGYYFEWWFKCPDCHTLYMVDEAKRFFASEHPNAIASKPKHVQPDDNGIAPWL